MNTIKTPRTEAVEINNFIKNWQIENPYDGKRKKYNEKFKLEFNQFLENQNYSEETTKLFKL